MKILFLGSHCDDIELGCGGIIHKFSAKHHIMCFTMSKVNLIDGILIDFHRQSQVALENILGAQATAYFDYSCNSFSSVRNLIWTDLHVLDEQIKPDIVFTQEPDFHQDHVILYEETMRNFRNANIIVYKSSLRSSPKVDFNYYEELSEANIDAKMKSVSQYKTDDFDLTERRRYCNPEAVRSIAITTGISVDMKYAEGFNIVRSVGWL